MASGDVLAAFFPADAVPADGGYGSRSSRNEHPIIEFDPDTDQAVDFYGVLPPNYGANGIDVEILWTAIATSGICRWESLFENLAPNFIDVDSSSFSSSKSAGTTTNATSGKLNTTEIAHTHGTQIAGIVAGNLYRVRIRRDADGTTGTDSMTGKSQIHAVVLREN